MSPPPPIGCGSWGGGFRHVEHPPGMCPHTRETHRRGCRPTPIAARGTWPQCAGVGGGVHAHLHVPGGGGMRTAVVGSHQQATQPAPPRGRRARSSIMVLRAGCGPGDWVCGRGGVGIEKEMWGRRGSMLTHLSCGNRRPLQQRHSVHDQCCWCRGRVFRLSFDSTVTATVTTPLVQYGVTV